MLSGSLLKAVFCMNEKTIKKVRYVQMNRDILGDRNYNDAEVRLLSYYHGFLNSSSSTSNININDKMTLKALGWGDNKLERTKKKLKDKGMLLVVQVGYLDYDYYIGEEAVKEGLMKNSERKKARLEEDVIVKDGEERTLKVNIK